jgi:signal transduction histidine kinase
MVVAPLLLPLVVHLVFAYPAGRVDSRPARAFVITAYAVTMAVSIGLALFRDPFLDRYCWANCTDNVFLVRPELDLSSSLDGYGLRAAALIGVLAAFAGGWRLVRATRVARRSMWLVVVPAAAAALATTGYVVRMLSDRAEDPADSSFRALFFVRATTLLATAFGVTWGACRIRRAERAITRLADELGTMPPPGSLGPALARSLSDEGLTVAYWLPSVGRHVDAYGRVVDPKPARGQASTAIVRAGQPVATVLHDRALTPAADIGAAARLAVDNERRRAEILAQLIDVRAARARVVVTADTTRLRLERDLHDGAQQRLLAATYELRLACSAATAAGDTALADTLTRACEQAQHALSELRELAHGIYPAILTEGGIDPAVRSLATRAPLPVEIDDLVTKRYPSAVEAAAYNVVATAIDTASRYPATYVAVRVSELDDHLVVEIRTDDPGQLLDVGLDDRVGALGGQLTVESGTTRAEIPCAS